VLQERLYQNATTCSILSTEQVVLGDPGCARLHRAVWRWWLINDRPRAVAHRAREGAKVPPCRQRRGPLIKQRLIVAAAAVVNLSEHCRRPAVEKNQPAIEMQTGCALRLHVYDIMGRFGHISFNRCFFRVLGDLRVAVCEVVGGASEKRRHYNTMIKYCILDTLEQSSVC